MIQESCLEKSTKHLNTDGQIDIWVYVPCYGCFDASLTWILLGPMFFTGGGWHGSRTTNMCPFKEAELTRLETVTSTANCPVLHDEMFNSITLTLSSIIRVGWSLFQGRIHKNKDQFFGNWILITS